MQEPSKKRYNSADSHSIQEAEECECMVMYVGVL